MFIVSKALLISSATVIVRAGGARGAIWLTPFATVLFSVAPGISNSQLNVTGPSNGCQCSSSKMRQNLHLPHLLGGYSSHRPFV